jgi:putative nucleotidyltransferase with HDIG domain
MRHASEPNASAQTMSRIITQDQSLTVRVLKLANSPAFGFHREVCTVGEAVLMLGMHTIRNLSLCASTYPWMTKPLTGYGLAPSEMWAHSLSVAVGSQVVAERCKSVNPDVAFTAGILHDLGKTAVSAWIENKMHTMVLLADMEGFDFAHVERQILGFDHQEVGAHMAKSWNLPSPLIDAMENHHRPLSSVENSGVVYCVHIADYLSMALGIGLGGDCRSYQFSEASLSKLKIPIGEVDSMADEMLDRYEKQERVFQAIAN